MTPTGIRLRGMLVAAIVWAVGASSASAAVVYDNGGPATSSTPYYANGSYLIADDAVLLPGASTINHLAWWGIYANSLPASDDFALLIFADDNGNPDEDNLLLYEFLTAASRVDTGLTAGGRSIFAFESDIDDFVLPDSTRVWVSIAGESSGIFEWAFSGSGAGESFSVRNASSGEWFPQTDGELAFNLSYVGQAVPEPGTIALVLAALATLRVTTHRRARLKSNSRSSE